MTNPLANKFVTTQSLPVTFLEDPELEQYTSQMHRLRKAADAAAVTLSKTLALDIC
jgi:hypothetical protein